MICLFVCYCCKIYEVQVGVEYLFVFGQDCYLDIGLCVQLVGCFDQGVEYVVVQCVQFVFVDYFDVGDVVFD